MVLFDINCSLAKQNYLQCDCYVDDLELCKEGLKFSFPTWVPGSYLIRDFSRFIVDMRVESEGQELELIQDNGTSWSIESTEAPVKISYTIYLFDTSPRSGYLDENRLFFDGCRVFLQISGALDKEHRISICKWKEQDKVHTTFNEVSIDDSGFGLYKANDYWDLIEHPVAIGDFPSISFDVAKVPHSCVVMEKDLIVDMDRLKIDVQKVCEGQVKFWQEMPIDRYIFFLGVEPNGYGGIEHTYSSSLLCSHSQLPIRETKSDNADYISLLGLFSHEYLHVWNVKRLRPEVFVKPNLIDPVYTEQLWIFEGITSYYDDLNLLRTGVITEKDYLKLLEKSFTRLYMNYGRHEQSLAESSFDAWTKFYQPNENSVNSIVSYYLKGSIIALMLDLKIIKDTDGKFSLEDVMRECWYLYYKDKEGMPENEFENVAERVTGLELKDFFNRAIRSTDDLDYITSLSDYGVKLELELNKEKLSESLGIVFEIAKPTVIRSVINGTDARKSGLCSGDEIISILGYRVTKNNMNMIVGNLIEKKEGQIIIARHGRIYTKNINVEKPANYSCKVSNSKSNDLQKKWLKVY